MSEVMVRIAEGALRGFIEESIQSEEGLSREDVEYIAAERERIRQMKLHIAA